MAHRAWAFAHLDVTGHVTQRHSTVVEEPGPREGILIPRGYPYWFERTGDEELEILQVEASDRLIASAEDLLRDRIDYARPHEELAQRLRAAETHG